MKIFITGVSSGIGRELTKQLISLNHNVWGVARRQGLLNELKAEINLNNFICNTCDITDSESIQKTIQAMQSRNFLPDVVVLNASIFPNDIINDYDHELAKKTFSTNYDGALIWVANWLPKFLQRGSGQFIAICSTAAFRANLRGIAYPASKAALAMTMRGFRLRFIKSKVKFSIIYFGPVTSQMWEGKKNPLLATPDDAARHIIRIIKSKKFQSYYPKVSTFIFRLLKFLPDTIFTKLTERTIK